MKRVAPGLLVAVMALSPRTAFACPVCFGQNDSPMAVATNMGILAMLVVVAGMLASFAGFFVYLNRRARLVNGPHDAASSTRPIGREGDPQEGTVQC